MGTHIWTIHGCIVDGGVVIVERQLEFQRTQHITIYTVHTKQKPNNIALEWVAFKNKLLIKRITYYD